MRYFLAIFIIAIMIGLFFISLDNLADFGISGLILAGISSFVLYRIFKFLFLAYRPDGAKRRRSSSNVPGGSYDPLEYVIYGDIAVDTKPDDWDE